MEIAVGKTYALANQGKRPVFVTITGRPPVNTFVSNSRGKWTLLGKLRSGKKIELMRPPGGPVRIWPSDAPVDVESYALICGPMSKKKVPDIVKRRAYGDLKFFSTIG